DVPAAAFVQPVPLAGRCLVGARPGEACAGGDGLCIGTLCGRRADRRTSCSPTIRDHCQPGQRCAGNCVPLGREGDACDAEGLAEHGGEGGLVCLEDHCTRLRAVGERCDAGEPCAPCATCEDGTCAAALSCSGTSDDECGFGTRCARGTCEPLAALG